MTGGIFKHADKFSTLVDYGKELLPLVMGKKKKPKSEDSDSDTDSTEDCQTPAMIPKTDYLNIL